MPFPALNAVINKIRCIPHWNTLGNLLFECPDIVYKFPSLRRGATHLLFVCALVEW